MLRQLPGKTEVPNLLVDISQTGLGAGLQQQLFQPQPEQSKDFYAELPIKIRLTGSYHQMGEFVSGIAALPRIVTLHDVEIKPAAARTRYDQLQLDVTAKTYRYLDDEEVAAVEASPQGERGDHAWIERLMMQSHRILHWSLAAALLAGCSSSATRTCDAFIDRTKQEQPGGVEPLPEVKPYESFFYTAQTMRSPFLPGGSGESSSPSVRPDSKRNREFLEQFSLDTLKMVGTLRHGRPHATAWCRRKDGIVHRVQPGNYLGQNDGRIAQIDDVEDQCYRNRSGRTRRLHGARRRAGAERMTGRETKRMNRYMRHPQNASSACSSRAARHGHRPARAYLRRSPQTPRQQAAVRRRAAAAGPAACSWRCTTSGPAPEPLSFTIDNPARISFDLPEHGARAGAASHRRAQRRPRQHPRRRSQWPLAPGAEPRPHAAVPDPRRRQQHRRDAR